MIQDFLHPLFLKYPKISTNTRAIENDAIFFALKGKNFNANKFAEEAIQKGASYAVIDDVTYKKDHRFILVEDVLQTLQELASFHRKYLNIPILSLTGSNGKTTTKELINEVLLKKFKTVATKGNLNNHIGVPLTLLSMDSTTEFGIVELGANHPKEIEFLVNLVQPDYGVITNFGRAHLEGFGNFEGVVKTKTELYDYLKNKDKLAFVNANDTLQLEHSKGIKRVTFGTENSDIPIHFLSASPFVSVLFKETEIHSQMIGTYNFNNIASAIAIGDYFDIPVADIKHVIENYTPANNRSQVIKSNSNTIILDAYNANPSSMMAALENLMQLPNKNKVVFLGDMFELGSYAAHEHEKIVRFLSDSDIDKIYLLGNNFYNTKLSSDKIIKFKDFDSLKNKQVVNDIKDAFILIKGSRGMQLERVLELL